MSSAVLEIEGLEKSYPVGFLGRERRRALEPLHLSLPAGEVFGYLGPNGSGKTTTLKLLMGLVFPDAGGATILGSPLDGGGWRHRVGYLPEHPYFYDYLTAREYLDYAGRLFGLPRERLVENARRLLERLDLTEAADIPLRRLSKGMQQRLGLAQALVNDPALVLLDEPMSGLDPIGRARVRDLIESLREDGRSVFFSTHILPDAESLCDRIGLLRGGRLLNVGRLDEILDVTVAHLEVLVTGAASLRSTPLPGVLQTRDLDDRWYLEVEDAALGGVVTAVEQAGGRIRSVLPKRLSLEEFFVREVARGAPAGRQAPPSGDA